MATFRYNALTAAGRLMKGTIEAGSAEEATEQLKGMELSVNSLDKAEPERPKTAIGRNEFLLFNQQLASITRAGIPLEKGLRELAEDVSSRSMRKLVEDIAADLEAGVPIEEAFQKREKHFPPLYGRILKAGVTTGRLSEMLTSLNRHLELAGQTRRIVFEALSYPIVVLILGTIIVSFAFGYIVPQFREVLQDIAGSNLPGVTNAVLALGENTAAIWLGLLVLAVVLIGVFLALSRSPAGRRSKEAMLLRVPIIGNLYRNSVLSRMAEAMAVLVGAGCDTPECLRLGAVASGSERLARESEELAGRIEQGANLLEAGQNLSLLPRLFLYSVQLGSQRNELQDNLHSLGDMYADQARVSQSRLQAVLLPVLIMAVGCILALAILSLFLPMIQVVTSLSAA